MTPLNVNTHNLFSTESLSWVSNLMCSWETVLQQMLVHFLDKNKWKTCSECQKDFWVDQARMLSGHTGQTPVARIYRTLLRSPLLQPHKQGCFVLSCVKSFIFYKAATFSWKVLHFFSHLFLIELFPRLLCLRHLDHHQILAFHQPTAKKALPEAGG